MLKFAHIISEESLPSLHSHLDIIVKRGNLSTVLHTDTLFKEKIPYCISTHSVQPQMRIPNNLESFRYLDYWKRDSLDKVFTFMCVIKCGKYHVGIKSKF